jgi:hypothetical protein
MSRAQFALLQRPALAIGVPGDHRRGGAAAAGGALCRIPAREQSNLVSHQLNRAPLESVSFDVVSRLASAIPASGAIIASAPDSCGLVTTRFKGPPIRPSPNVGLLAKERCSTH